MKVTNIDKVIKADLSFQFNLNINVIYNSSMILAG